MKIETFKKQQVLPLYSRITSQPTELLWYRWLQKWFVPLLIAGILVNLSGLLVPILEPDGALYALIAKTIAQTGDFINLKLDGTDWLDKPHFPFWITAVSFKVFGVNTFAYKLPAVLFAGLGGVYTYLLAKRLYNVHIAMLAVLVYLTAAHGVISNNDVRAEPYLTGLVVGSVFHFLLASDRRPGIHLCAGSLLTAMAIMTKGPFLLAVIGSGFAIKFAMEGNIRQIFHFRWLLALLLIFIFVLPELYCLYVQFDAHPEKVVFGQTGVSGIRFFFWDSQFGRFTNNGPIKGKGNVLFYTHTLLWAFLPWSLMLYAAFYKALRGTTRTENGSRQYLIYGTVVFTLLLFSLSRFQLPHYTNIVFPFFAIITADYLYRLRAVKTIRTWSFISVALCSLLVVAIVVLIVLLDTPGRYVVGVAIMAFALLMLWRGRHHPSSALFKRLYCISCVVYLAVNLIIYPALLSYQSGLQAARFINTSFPGYEVYDFKAHSFSFAFYLNAPVHFDTSTAAVVHGVDRQPAVLFTSEDNLAVLRTAGVKYHILKSFPHFHISQLTGKFLFPRTRYKQVTQMVVLRIVHTSR